LILVRANPSASTMGIGVGVKVDEGITVGVEDRAEV
jgi:hypothetical protein